MEQRKASRVLILSYATLGVYTFVWLAKTRAELLEEGGEIPPLWVLVCPLVPLVSAVGMIWALGGPALALGNYFLIATVALAVGIISIFATIGVWVYWFLQYTAAIETVTDGAKTQSKLFRRLVFMSIILLGGVWAASVQKIFNNIEPDNVELAEDDGNGVEPVVGPV